MALIIVLFLENEFMAKTKTLLLCIRVSLHDKSVSDQDTHLPYLCEEVYLIITLVARYRVFFGNHYYINGSYNLKDIT